MTVKSHDSEGEPPLAAHLRAAMRRLPSAVAVITASAGDGAIGITATSIAPVSLTPPTMLACVNRALRLHGAVSASKYFRINFLNEDQDHVARAFAGSAFGPTRFEAGEWDLVAPGGAALQDALISLACRLLSAHDCGSHTIFVGAVESVREGVGDALLYCDRRYKNLAQECSP